MNFKNKKKQNQKKKKKNRERDTLSSQRVSVVRVTQSCLTLWDLMDCSLHTWNSPNKKYWSGLPHPPPGDLPDSGIKSKSSTLQIDSLLSESTGKPNSGKMCRIVSVPMQHSTDQPLWFYVSCRIAIMFLDNVY